MKLFFEWVSGSIYSLIWLHPFIWNLGVFQSILNFKMYTTFLSIHKFNKWYWLTLWNGWIRLKNWRKLIIEFYFYYVFTILAQFQNELISHVFIYIAVSTSGDIWHANSGDICFLRAIYLTIDSFELRFHCTSDHVLDRNIYCGTTIWFRFFVI